MPRNTEGDTIRILVATDNHVGAHERDPVRGDDSWKAFDEIMCLAKQREVDMVLLAGDLFHENKPSRKALYQVMRSLRTNCYGNKPCELQMLSDGSEHFAGAFNHVNYDDEDINVAIPVFSIHGNHDDPSGEGHLAALDILQMSGLLNYYGRTPESDNIHIKPVLLQKGQTKLALYGMSNVRDERLFRTFRDGQVKFFQPNTAQDEWFNIMSVHQNHHAYTETSYLPEQFLPSFMDLIIWGHEHECKIDPQTNPEMGFKVMQPGSSIATSLVKGEAVPKHVAIISVTGTEFQVEPIRLKSVRPFIVKEIALKDYPELREIAQLDDNRTRINQFLDPLIEELIAEARESWMELNGDEMDEDDQPPLPLIRLRVECTPPEGGKFDAINPQRFSHRFHEKVANASDVIQFHRKRKATKATKIQPDMPDDDKMAAMSIDSVKVDKLVKEFLTAQSLTILPQNRFNDAVGQFVDKDDKHAMEEFLVDSLEHQKNNLLGVGFAEGEDDEDAIDDDRIIDAIENHRIHLEAAHARGELRRRRRKGTLKPRPDGWDSDVQGPWEDSMMAIIVDDDDLPDAGDEDDESSNVATSSRTAQTKGATGRAGKTTASTSRKPAATARKAAAKPKTNGRGKKKPVSDNDDDEDGDVIMIDEDDEEESQGLFVSQAKTTTTRSRAQRSESPAKKTPARSTRGRGGAAAATRGGTQAKLNFGSGQASQVNGSARSTGTGRTTASKSAPSKRLQPSEDEISDDDDAFEPAPAAQRSTRTGRR